MEIATQRAAIDMGIQRLGQSGQLRFATGEDREGVRLAAGEVSFVLSGLLLHPCGVQDG